MFNIIKKKPIMNLNFDPYMTTFKFP